LSYTLFSTFRRLWRPVLISSLWPGDGKPLVINIVVPAGADEDDDRSRRREVTSATG